MKVRRQQLGVIVVLMFVSLELSGFAGEESKQATTSERHPTVTLHYGNLIPLPPDSAQALYEKGVELLESSNFNSRAPRWEWNFSQLQDDYRQTVAGKYLLISFSTPQKIKTVGGGLSVREIVIGLNRSDYANSLFTIDDEGRIVGHGKYSGGLCIELLQLVKKITQEV